MFDYIILVLYKFGWFIIEVLLCLCENDCVFSYLSINFVN